MMHGYDSPGNVSRTAAAMLQHACRICRTFMTRCDTCRDWWCSHCYAEPPCGCEHVVRACMNCDGDHKPDDLAYSNDRAGEHACWDCYEDVAWVTKHVNELME